MAHNYSKIMQLLLPHTVPQRNKKPQTMNIIRFAVMFCGSKGRKLEVFDGGFGVGGVDYYYKKLNNHY